MVNHRFGTSQGTNGLSRAELTSSRVMAGDKLLKLIPLNETAFEIEADLGTTVQSWLPGKWKFVKRTDWYHELKKDPEGSWIWAPPPMLAKVALEELCKIKHMYPKSRHLFMCPVLMTENWRKRLEKITDTTLSLCCNTTVRTATA